MKQFLFVLVAMFALVACTKVETSTKGKTDTIRVHDTLRIHDTIKVVPLTKVVKWEELKKEKKWLSNHNDSLPTSKFQDDSLNIESGTASYYDYNTPRITANGERFNPKALTCAYYRHTNEKRKYLNKYIKVCTDTCIVLKCTDNGAFRDAKYAHLNRKVDLTPYAMTLLGGSRRQGVINVKVYY